MSMPHKISAMIKSALNGRAGVIAMLIMLLMVNSLVVSSQDDKTVPKKDNKPVPKAQPKSLTAEEEIPDSLLHPRWKIKKTVPVTVEDLDSTSVDLKSPDNVKQTTEYDDSLNMYFV